MTDRTNRITEPQEFMEFVSGAMEGKKLPIDWPAGLEPPVK